MTLFWKIIKFLPIVVFFTTPLAVFSTYALAVVWKHVNPLFPYISDAGTTRPESCIFTFFLSLNSFFLTLLSYVRYRQISDLLKLKPSITIKPRSNKIAFVAALLTCLGLHILSSFQESAEFTTHCVGAFTVFFSASFYFVMQTVFTRKAYPENQFIFGIRVFLCVIMLLSLVASVTPIYFAVRQFTVLTMTVADKGVETSTSMYNLTTRCCNQKSESVLLWSEKDGGYHLHLVSTFSEWILVFCFTFFMGTFHWDFTKFYMEPPVLKFWDLNAKTEGV